MITDAIWRLQLHCAIPGAYPEGIFVWKNNTIAEWRGRVETRLRRQGAIRNMAQSTA
jgi:hypothetical protein